MMDTPNDDIVELADNEIMTLEMAQQEFDRWADEMDLEFETDIMGEETLDDFNFNRRKICRSLQRGDLIINAEGYAEYTPRIVTIDKPLVWKQLSGKTIAVVDGKKKNESVKKTFHAMAKLTGVHHSVFENMTGIDRKVCDVLFILLAV